MKFSNTLLCMALLTGSGFLVSMEQQNDFNSFLSDGFGLMPVIPPVLHALSQLNFEVDNCVLQIGQEDLDRCFLEAIIRDDVIAAKLCIERGVNLHMGALLCSDKIMKPLKADLLKAFIASARETGFFPLGVLHLAARYGSVEIIKLLLSMGLDIDELGAKGVQPIHMAIVFKQPKAVKLLLDAGADTSREVNNCSVQTLAVLHDAAEIVQLFIDRGFDVNRPESHGLNLLEFAIGTNNVAIVDIIARNGAQLNELGYGDDYLLHLVIEHSSDEEIRKQILLCLIKYGAQVNILNKQGNRPIHIAAFRNCKKIVQALVEHGADVMELTSSGHTARDIAVQFGHHDLAKWLAKQMFVESVKKEQHLSGRTNECVRIVDVDEAITNGDIEAIKGYLDEHYRKLYEKRFGHLHYIQAAAICGNVDIAKLLITHDPSYKLDLPTLDAPDYPGLQPIHLAAMYGNSDFIDWLLSQGVDMHALGSARFHGGTTHKDDIKLTKAGFPWADFMEPIHCAAHLGHLNVIELLVAKGVSVSTPNKSGNRPLHFAVLGGHQHVVDWLLQHGADLKAKNKKGKNAHYLAQICGKKELIAGHTKSGGNCLLS